MIVIEFLVLFFVALNCVYNIKKYYEDKKK